MTRPILLSNGQMHVGINLYGMVHDFYYPWVGLENHAPANNMRHRVGVWSGGGFSWLDDGNWQFSVKYQHNAQIGHTTAHNAAMGVTMQFTDCVASDANAFMRSIHLINATDTEREIRLFMQQVFHIGSSQGGDTAQYLPEEHAILHFKGRRNFIVGGKDQSGKPFNQHAIGLFGTEGREGTFRDAEDGHLVGNAVEFGQVDSVIGFSAVIKPYESDRIEYWVAAGKSQWEASALHTQLQKEGVQSFITRTERHWHKWLATADKQLTGLPANLHHNVVDNLMIIKSHIDHEGAVIASTDTTMLNYSRDSYAYCWPRDACYVLWPLLRLGYKSELKNFFKFCRDALHPDGFLFQKFRPDRAQGSSWLPYFVSGRVIPPIQEDETAIVVFLCQEYMERHKDKELLGQLFDSLIVPAANFMASYVNPATKLPHASYDLWEEKFLTTTYTTATVYAALKAAAKLAEQYHRPKDAVRWYTAAEEMYEAAHKLLYNSEQSYFYKGLITKEDGSISYDSTIDTSSLYGAVMFNLFDTNSPQVKDSVTTLHSLFSWTADSPTIALRYEQDAYYRQDPASKGNPWFICTLWMAQYDILVGNTKRANATMQWVQSCMLGTGVLSEQIHPITHAFTSVAPLAWSQAEFVSTALDLLAQHRRTS